MNRPLHVKGETLARVYGVVTKEDYNYLFREVLPTWGATRRIVSHLIHIFAQHARRANIHTIPSVVERERAIDGLLGDIGMADFTTGSVVVAGPDDHGGRPVERTSDAS